MAGLVSNGPSEFETNYQLLRKFFLFSEQIQKISFTTLLEKFWQISLCYCKALCDVRASSNRGKWLKI